MALPILHRLSITSSIDWFYAQQPYLLTFGKTRVSIWRSGRPAEGFHHIARLHPAPESQAQRPYPIIDAERDIIIIGDRGPEHNSAGLLVFSLVSGQRIREVELFGALPSVSKGPLQHRDGKVLIVVEEDEERAPPYGRTTALLCDAAGTDGIVGGLTLPPCLASRDEKRLNAPGGVLLPVALMPNGDIIATSSVVYGETMDVLRYRGSNIVSTPEPDASFTLHVPVSSGYNDIEPLCTTPLDKRGFLMAVYEADCGVQQVQQGCQSSIYAVDAGAMKIRWRAEPVGGQLHSIHNITALDAIVAFGQHDSADGEGNDPFAYVPVLNPTTGAQRQLEDFRHPILETTRDPVLARNARVLYCGLCNKGDRLTIVVVFRDGLVYATNFLRQFLKDGLPHGHGDMAVTEPLKEGWRVLQADVVGWTVVMLVNEEATGRSRHIRYVSLH